MGWRGILSCIMRMNLSARVIRAHGSDVRQDRISLTIRPACPVPGDYSCTMNSDSLRRILRQTDLPATVLDRFERGIYSPQGGKLLAVELTEATLTAIGYFID